MCLVLPYVFRDWPPQISRAFRLSCLADRANLYLPVLMTLHRVIATLLGFLILSRGVAGLYHQYARKDGLLGRMWFGGRGA